MKQPCGRCSKPIASGYTRTLFGSLICKKCLTPDELDEVKRGEERMKNKKVKK
jgi:hypothetical protein